MESKRELPPPVNTTFIGIPKYLLQNGHYYAGRCRNASIARWDEKHNHFVYWREKFGSWFMEPINHYQDDDGFDLFVPVFDVTYHFNREIELPFWKGTPNGNEEASEETHEEGHTETGEEA